MIRTDLAARLRFEAQQAVAIKLAEADQWGVSTSEFMEARALGLIQLTDDDFEEFVHNQRKLK